jgi:hypothetical protein
MSAWSAEPELLPGKLVRLRRGVARRGLEGADQLRPAQAQLPEVRARLAQRQVERERPRIDGSGQVAVVISGLIEPLRVGVEFGGRQRGLPHACVRVGVRGGHVGLQQLVRQVDVRQRGVGVLTVQLDVLQVGPPVEQDRLGGDSTVARLRVALLEELQDVDQVGGVAEH